MGSAWIHIAQFEHRHAMLYNEFYIAGTVPAQFSLTRERGMLQDYIISPGQTQLVLPAPSDSIITYSEAIPADCHGTHYSIALWGSRRLRGCPMGKRETTYADPGHRRWPAVSINTVHRVWPHWGRFKGRVVPRTVHPLIKAMLQSVRSPHMWKWWNAVWEPHFTSDWPY